MARRAPAEQAAPPAEPIAGKGRATPSRRQQEAARKQPLVARDRKAARRTSRTREAEQRERARIGLANGEERYLPVRDRGPQRRFARDWIDASWTLGEVTIPIFFVALLVTLAVPGVAWLAYVGYGVLALAIVDAYVRSLTIRRRLAARFGADQVQRGLPVYVVMRSLQLRRWRTPKPQVPRGRKPA